MDQRKIVTPSEFLYFKGNKFYEERDFDQAIALYEEFLDRKPNSDLVIPAKLNLGMSLYYKKEFKEAHTILSGLDIKDESIKNYVSKVLETCKAEAKDGITAQDKSSEKPAQGKPGTVPVKIIVLDAYLDNFGSVVLKGKTDKVALIKINQKMVYDIAKNNEFEATVSWKKGRPISISAKDDDGHLTEIDFFPDGEPPDEPEGLRVLNITDNSIEIEWNDNYEDDIKGYRLFYRLKGESLREIQELITDTRYEVISLARLVKGVNKTFQFHLKAVDKMENESPPSDTLEATLP